VDDNCNVVANFFRFSHAQAAKTNQLIVGPQFTTSKVLRETYGERFLDRSRMRIFIQSISFLAFRFCETEVNRDPSYSKINVLYLFFLEALLKEKNFFDEVCCTN
jgi:hypothetical protein